MTDPDLPVPAEALEKGLGSRGIADMEHGTAVILPSISFPGGELRKIVGIQHYEERMLFMTLLLERPGLHMTYVTSVPVDDAVIDYYLRFLHDPAGARRRLTMISVGDPEPRALTAKILERPDLVEAIRASVGSDEAYMLPFNVTYSELQLSEATGIPLLGPHPDLVALGSKSGSRAVAKAAGVPVLDGHENLSSLGEVESELAALRERRPNGAAAVIKLNNGFSGQGNAIVDFSTMTFPITEAPTVFCAEEESWPSFARKIEEEGGIVEELVRVTGMASPSVQIRIAPDGSHEVVSTHDQILGGPDGQVYLGCRFPARTEYRLAIQEQATQVAKVLASRGVIGSFGIDFVVIPAGDEWDVVVSEINLRLGGTTHPFLMAKYVTGGTYDDTSGDLVVDRTRKFYMATDNLKSDACKGLDPAAVIAELDARGLAYDRATKTGVTLHLLGALKEYGKLGAVCIADSLADADRLYAALKGMLADLAR